MNDDLRTRLVMAARLAMSQPPAAEPPDGYLKRCEFCGQLIYLKQDWDGQWRPYESWVAGTVDEGEWKTHDCDCE
ncbi:MAG: hypothetical protein D6741_03665 [Planctomycetota bacterium]|nr:MAG: hypothetical protein D6741_03665 [Planctomycetota bacterium]